ncbi:MAG: transposase [Desulfamplus sp.]|nr:transposase [Desulfamplus sp.]
MERTKYSSDLTDRQWEIIKPLLVLSESRAGRPPKYDLREIINAILYIVHTGCQWRELRMIFRNGRVYIIISANIKKQQMVIDSYVNT